MTSVAGRVTGEPAVILHVRPYRETSAIVSLLTLNHGRIALVGRGVRGGKKGSALQPFNRMTVGWVGRGSLGTLTGYEAECFASLQGTAVAAGFYVLELISRLVGEHESVPGIFAGTCWCLERLELGDRPVDVSLRCFEKLLLEELGYGLNFSRDAETGEAIDGEAHYLLSPETGFVRAPRSSDQTVPGSVLAEIADESMGSKASRVAAKRLFRAALDPLLGPRPIASRRLLPGLRA